MPESCKQGLLQEDIPLQRASGLVLIAGTPKGRGVFASHPIPSGAVIDVSPVLIFTPEEVAQHTSKTCLDHYTYNWPNSSSKQQALALGLGSLFNHSRLRQNIGWKRDIPNTCIIYTALRDIALGEELCISYGGLWFQDADDEIGVDATSRGIREGAACGSMSENDRKAEFLMSVLGHISIDTDVNEPGVESQGGADAR